MVEFLSDEIVQKESHHPMQDIAVFIFDSREYGTGYQ